MKLTKRRSSPYLPAPSSLWLPDSHHPSPNPTAHPTPLASQSTSSLIPKRLPFRRRGQSAGPELQLRKDDPNLGTDYENRLEAQTHTQTQPHQTGGLESDGNVFGFSSYDDHCRRPVYTRSISVNTEMIGGVDDRKRDSTGRNRYPPNSLAPDRGWGFGRMRKSRQQDLRIVMPERVESLGWKDSSFASLSNPQHLSPPTSPNPDHTNTQEDIRSPMTLLPVSPSSPLYPSSPKALRDNDVGGPSSFTRHLSFILNNDPVDDLDMQPPLPLPGSPSSLTRSASLSETVTSRGSSHPLIESIRRSRSYLAIPRFKNNSNTIPRKLQKRRTGSHDPTVLPSPKLGRSSLRNKLHLQEIQTRKEEQGRTTTPPPRTVEDHPEADAEADTAWTLARNSSTSTSCGSMIAPSSEESTVLTPPYHAIGEDRGSDTWDTIDVPTVSRSSTSSYRSSESQYDVVDRGLNMLDIKQILSDDSTARDEIPARPLVRPQASFLSEDTVMPMPSPEELESHSSNQTPSPTSTAQAVDFTASPINNSTSPTSPETSNSSPINRIRNDHIRSRASSIAAMSMNRASDYSIGSIGEIGVANTGSMVPATIVHLESTDISRPHVRPGVQRSKSEAAHPYSKAPGPYISKEPLHSSSLIPLPTVTKIRPKPSPRLSLPLLGIEIAEPDLIEAEKKIFSPSRSLSLSKLWRKISTSRRKSKQPSSDDIPRIPKSVSCVDVSISKPNDTMTSPASSFRLPFDELIIPEVPTPAPRSSSLAAMRSSGTSSCSFGSVSTGTVNGVCPRPISPRKSSLSTPPSVMVSDYSGVGSYFPRGLTGPSFLRAAEAPSTRTIIEGVALTSTPQITPGINVDLGQENKTSPPRVARRRPEHRRARFSMDDAEPSPSLEERRKYRQTLVDIQDDAVFHQVLQDLARLEKQEDDKRERETSSTSEGGHGNEVREEWKPDKGEIRAWFVTRELVQGERRHGRLLARGVATVQAAAESRRDEVPPLPIPGTPDRTQSSVNLTQLPSRTSFLSRRTASRSTTSVSVSANSSSTHLSPLSINVSPMLRTRPLPSQAPPSPTTSPLELLLERLPRLLALSLTLSSRFEDDPSPFGVAEAFVKMEEEMIREIGLWAGEVGNIVAVGMGEMLDLSASRGRSRRSISGDAMTDDETQEDRLGFADIIIMPIQRAARYKLLFQEMLMITPTATRSYTTVSQALESAEKLAGECDRRQVFDLHAIRRQSGQSQAKKKGKERPRSVGVNIDRKEKNWVMGKGVGVEF